MSKHICMATLEKIYDAIKAIEAETDSIRKVLRNISGENEYFGSDNVHVLEKLAYSATLGGDAQLVDDFEYLLYEVPAVESGGSITTVNGTRYEIRNFADLWLYWMETEVVANG